MLQITDQGGLVGPTESGGRNKEDDGAGVSALRPSVEEGGVPLPPIDEDSGEKDDTGDITDCATGSNSSGEGVDDGSGSVQPGASASSPSGSGETSLTPDSSSADTLPTAVRTIQRQLSAYLTGPHDHEEHRVGRTRADERAARRTIGGASFRLRACGDAR